MMRDRFKFRAWSKRDYRMLKGYPVIKKGKLESFIEDITGSIYGIEYWPFQLMQCTGLKDINGNLIYEGDIIKKDSALFVVDIMPYMCLSPVIKNTGETHYYEPGNNNFTGAEDYRHQDNMEIVGNIYENPELIRN